VGIGCQDAKFYAMGIEKKYRVYRRRVAKSFRKPGLEGLSPTKNPISILRMFG
jgi:hypothetical protein